MGVPYVSMCTLCNAKNALGTAVSRLNDAGSPDIASKFAAFVDHVSASQYADDPAVSKKIKVRCLNSALRLCEGYMPTDRKAFELKIDEFRASSTAGTVAIRIRDGMRVAMLELFDLYGMRLPWALYGGYMFMVTRPNLHQAERLPELAPHLPEGLPWETIDAVWHGLPPATSLYLHILSVINRHTGTIPLHGCGCNHYLPALPGQGDPKMMVVFPAPTPDQVVTETEVPVSHMLLAIESLARGLPHALGETDKSLNHHADAAQRAGLAKLPEPELEQEFVVT